MLQAARLAGVAVMILGAAWGQGLEGKELRLAVGDEAAGWRRRIGEWRFINLGVMNRILGFNARLLDGARARELGLKEGDLALVVGRVERSRLHGVELRRGDVIIEIDGRRAGMSLGEVTRYVAVEKKPGSSLELVRLRRGDKRRLGIRVQ